VAYSRLRNFLPGYVDRLNAYPLPQLTVVVTNAFSAVVASEVPIVSSLYGDVGFFIIGSGSEYDGSSPEFSRLVYEVFTSGEMTPWPSPCGSNCSYSISFFGPAYNCVSATYNDWTWLEVLANQSGANGPTGDYTLFWAADLKGNLTEQGLYFLLVTPASPNAATPPASSNATVVHCQLHNTTYDTDVQFVSNQLNTSTVLTYHEQLNNSLGSLLGSDDYPNSSSYNETWALVNYFAVSQGLITLLAGSANDGYLYGNIEWSSEIYLSNLAEPMPTGIAYPANFSQMVVDLLTNVTLSLISSLFLPPFPSIGTDVVHPAAVYTTVNATIVTSLPRYSYSASILWVLYGTAIGFTMLTVILGTILLIYNGVDGDMSFTQIVVTTRNKALDELSVGACLGGEKISKGILKTSLKFGELQGSEPRHACFGKEEEIIPLMKNEDYEGMSKTHAE